MTSSVKKLSEIVKHPATYLMVGDTGEGKTATGAAILDLMHSQGVYCYMIDKQKGYPEWIKNLDSSNINMKEPNSVLFVDDAHNLFYGGEEYEFNEELKALDLISRARRHGGKRSVIINTQMTGALSRKLIGMSTYVVFKKSSPLQIEFERPEVKKLCQRANEALKDKPINIGYVIGKDYEGLIDIEVPKWYSTNLSESAEHYRKREQKEQRSGLFGALTEIIKGIGSMKN